MPERAILFLAIAQTLIWASASYIFAALLLWWEADLGWSRAQLTGAFTVALLVSATTAPTVGKLIDKGKGPLVMGVTSVIAGLLVGSLSLVTEVWQFYAIWIAIGMMISGCLYEPCFAIITRARGPAGRKAIVTITLMAGFASTISFPLANSLAEAQGWQFAVLVFCAIAVLIAAPLNYLGARDVENAPWEEAKIDPVKDFHAADRAYLRQPAFWCLGLGFACGAMLQQMTVNHLLAILMDRDVLRDVAILAASFIGPMQVAGRIAMVAAGERASNHFVAICSFIAMGISAVMLMFAGYSPGFIAGFAIFFGAAHGVVSIIRPGLAWEILGGENYGAKSGTLASFFFVGGAIAPFTGSLIWKAGGYDLVLICLLLLASAGLCLYLAAQSFAKRSTA